MGKSGFKWLKLHCINITGQMKREPISRRIEIAEQSLENMLDSANNPFDGFNFFLNFFQIYLRKRLVAKI